MKTTHEWRVELIAKLKLTESKNDIISLVGNLPTMKLILAWPNVAITFSDEQQRGDKNPSDRRKIWHGVELDYDEIAEISRLPHSVVREHVREAQAHLWIYPDNTVHRFAKELAQATIVKIAKAGGGD